jgi:hypothetical protein
MLPGKSDNSNSIGGSRPQLLSLEQQCAQNTFVLPAPRPQITNETKRPAGPAHFRPEADRIDRSIKSDFGRLVARHFHADAYFRYFGCRPSH